MSTSHHRRVAALETETASSVVIRVVPPSVAADAARLAAWRAEIARALPPGTRVLEVLTGVPRAGDDSR